MQQLLEEFGRTKDFLPLFRYSLELCKNEKLGEPKPRFDSVILMKILLAYILKVEERALKGIPTTMTNLRLDWHTAIHDTYVDDRVRLLRTFAKMHRLYVREAKPSEKLTDTEFHVLISKIQEAFMRSYQQVDLTIDLMIDLIGDRPDSNMWKGTIPIVSDKDSMDYTHQFKSALERGDFEAWWLDEKN